MSRTATVRARVEPALKAEAEEVLEGLGLNPTAAITLYYEQIALRRALPFAIFSRTQQRAVQWRMPSPGVG